ncbi:serine/threonine protein kinase [Spirillospora sp. CA-128828]|uniref:serine/threonine protein kinase n=1 Tax=Spirillospora sp. CA-128828 TaxID=3240033 RepID=UPI003D8BD61E
MPEALPLQPGDPRRLGSFEITGRLGVGEQGAVFLGRDTAGGPVAVKVLHVRLSGEPVSRSRFTGAFSSARKVSGFCTAAILHADVEGDRPYVVSEWVDGPSLQQIVDEEGLRGGTVVERVAAGMAVALAAIHRAGALHHNLKPGNVLLGRNGPRMSDFGIARALEAVNVGFGGHMTEDPAYKSPEQLSGLGIGPAADVFAWASTLLFAATGKPPFGEGSPSEVMQRIVYDEADLSDVPDSLRDIMASALAKSPAERPTAREVLERFLSEDDALAGRLPSSMVEEGRALAAGTVPERHVPPPSPPPAAPPPPPRVDPPRPPADDLDPAAFETTAAFDAVGSHRPEPRGHAGGRDHEEQTARFDAVRPERTATFDAVDLEHQANPGEPMPHFVPGLRHGRDSGGHRASPLASLAKMRRPGNHVLGVALSMFIGVSVGIAIIALVLWPQLKADDDGPPSDSTNSSNNRPVTTIPASFAGTWKGTVVNTGRNASFPVEITFEAGGTTGQALYPRENCTGSLTLTRGTESALKMNLDIGKPCTSGTVQVSRQPDGTLQYTWTKAGTSLGYGGRLTRS